MLRKKNLVVVGLTTFNTEMLRISVSAMARIKTKFTLVVHNDNPAQTVTVRDIRAYGYDGRLHIINSTKNVGLRAARLRILDAADAIEPGAKWIIYVDDDDILTNADVPNVGTGNFAVIQNSLVITRRVSDLIAAVTRPNTITPDGENVILCRPNMGLRGTAVRMDVMRGAAAVMHAADERLREIDASTTCRQPVDAMMWGAVNAYARRINPDFTPIFMDSVNYIRNGIDGAAVKYGRPGASARSATVLERAMERYAAAVAAAMTEL